jgi:hypothetical protein
MGTTPVNIGLAFRIFTGFSDDWLLCGVRQRAFEERIKTPEG